MQVKTNLCNQMKSILNRCCNRAYLKASTVDPPKIESRCYFFLFFMNTKNLTWRQKTVIRILMLVAHLVSEDAETKKELQAVANHISVWSPKED